MLRRVGRAPALVAWATAIALPLAGCGRDEPAPPSTFGSDDDRRSHVVVTAALSPSSVRVSGARVEQGPARSYAAEPRHRSE
jgi:hypothetical protein